jgi:hypothetical protein
LQPNPGDWPGLAGIGQQEPSQKSEHDQPVREESSRLGAMPSEPQNLASQFNSGLGLDQYNQRLAPVI